VLGDPNTKHPDNVIIEVTPSQRCHGFCTRNAVNTGV
jgi:hypothetical protein